MEPNEQIVVIPAYEPNDLMIGLIERLNQFFHDFSILIVNDGSLHADEIFAKAKEYSNVTIVNHEVNKGKGRALKTAFEYILNHMEGHHIIVTADADGQHSPEDIYKVASYYDEHKEGLVLGSRQFEKKVPLRSRFGNDATKVIYRLVNGRKLNDNQTGLRAFGSELLPFMIDVNGEKYEYEMNMLMECPRRNISISEVPIKAIYINNNSSSHFRPVRDFLRICKHMLKYILPSFISFLVSILIFYISLKILLSAFEGKELDYRYIVLLAAVISCIFGSIFYMLLHRFGLLHGNKYIFNNRKRRNLFYLGAFITSLANVGFIFGFYVLLEDYAGAKTLSDIDIIAFILLGNYLIMPKVRKH